MKKAVSLLLAFVLVLASLTGCGSKEDTDSPAAETKTEESDAIYRTLDEIKESGKITIGVFSDKNPFGYVDENGEYQGYDIYFAKRLAEDLDVELEYVSTEPASRVEYLESGKVDVILANFTVTEERAESVDFALPYMKVALGVVSPDDALVTKPEDLNGKKLIVAKGTTAETYFTENYPEVELLKFDQYTEAYNALLDGRGDALSTDNTEVLAWALQNDGFSVGLPSLGDLDTIAPAVSKGNDTLKDWINEEIKSLADEEFFHADYKETLEPVYGTEVDIDSLVVEGGVIEGGEAADTDAGDDAEDADSEADPAEEKGSITVAASSTPHAEILEEAKDLLKKEGWDLEITVFDDYVQPNLVVENEEFDANYFQHIPYLDDFNQEQGTHLVNAGGIHYEPFGIYPGTKKSLDDLEKGDVIAVPNDTTNEARALLLLEANGVITLKKDAGLAATVKDIEENPNDIEIQELEAAQVSRVKDEVAYVVLNGNYALQAGFSVAKDSIAYETSDSEAAKTYVNVIAVKEGNETSDGIKALIDALKSDEIKTYIEDTYDGAVIPFEE
ncbi:MAG: transporter substrate-binding domain-containing protein [Lachnospiraceae bacterium]|nr:transporter substrate-binding domain-containing protein [Lachnospiraceae bacterium]